MRLLKQLTLTFTRYAEGHYNGSGEWVEGATTTYDAQCNLQPYKDGKMTTVLPAGIKATDVFVCYTASSVNTTEQYNDKNADTTVIDGQTFVAMNVGNWSKFTTLRLNHHKIYLVRRDKSTNGGL